MNRKNVYLNLLKDIDKIAKANNIKYIVHGETSVFIKRDKNIGLFPDKIRIAMAQGDAEKFRKYFLDNKADFPDRTIESMLENTKMNYSGMLFGDKNTFEMELRELNPTRSNNYREHNIKIYIDFIEKITPINYEKKKRYIDKVWKICNFNLAGAALLPARIGIAIFNLLMNIVTLGYFKKKRYYDHRKMYAIESWNDIAELDNVKIMNTTFPTSLFDHICFINTDENISFPILKNFDEYFNRAFKGKKEDDILNASNLYTGLSSTEFGYDELKNDKEFQKYMHEVRVSREKVFPIRAKTLKYRNGIRKIKRVVKMTGEEVPLKDYYLEKEAEIMRLYKDKNFEMLSELFVPLKESLFYYEKYKMTYTISDDINFIFDETEKWKGNRNKINSIKELRKKRYYA